MVDAATAQRIQWVPPASAARLPLTTMDSPFLTLSPGALSQLTIFPAPSTPMRQFERPCGIPQALPANFCIPPCDRRALPSVMVDESAGMNTSCAFATHSSLLRPAARGGQAAAAVGRLIRLASAWLIVYRSGKDLEGPWQFLAVRCSATPESQNVGVSRFAPLIGCLVECSQARGRTTDALTAQGSYLELALLLVALPTRHQNPPARPPRHGLFSG